MLRLPLLLPPSKGCVVLLRSKKSRPYISKGCLVIPFNSPKKYRFWDGGQSVLETLKELNAPEWVIEKYSWWEKCRKNNELEEERNKFPKK